MCTVAPLLYLLSDLLLVGVFKFLRPCHQLNTHPFELQAALQIRSDNFIQGCGSVDQCYGSVWIRIRLFSSLTFKTPAKTFFFFRIYIFFNISHIQKSQNSRNQGFSFSLMTEGSASASGSVPLADGSGSGSRRLKNLRIRIYETGGNRLF
jgi:hypothetical protein